MKSRSGQSQTRAPASALPSRNKKVDARVSSHVKSSFMVIEIRLPNTEKLAFPLFIFGLELVVLMGGAVNRDFANVWRLVMFFHLILLGFCALNVALPYGKATGRVSARAVERRRREVVEVSRWFVLFFLAVFAIGSIVLTVESLVSSMFHG